MKKERNIKITGRRKATDIGKFVLAVVQLAEKLAEEETPETERADSRTTPKRRKAA